MESISCSLSACFFQDEIIFYNAVCRVVTSMAKRKLLSIFAKEANYVYKEMHRKYVLVLLNGRCAEVITTKNVGTILCPTIGGEVLINWGFM